MKAPRTRGPRAASMIESHRLRSSSTPNLARKSPCRPSSARDATELPDALKLPDALTTPQELARKLLAAITGNNAKALRPRM